MSSAEQQLISLQVSFGAAPPQALVTPLCQSLVEMCRTALDEDAASRVRLAAHELLENIAKYSAEQACELRFALRRGGDGRMFASVETRNVPRAENRQDAARRLAALCSAADPRAHYDAVIAHSAREPAGSGLGLARIHAETEYRISHRFEDDALVIVASGEVYGKKGELP